MALTSSMECGDILEFQNTLKQMRQIDDKIIYVLNTTIPTESFKTQVNASHSCKDLFQQIQSVHSQRDIAIKKCLYTIKGRIEELKKQRDDGNIDSTILKSLRKAQVESGILQSELSIEEVIKKQTSKVYYEKCRRFYKPEKLLN
ncbi:PREDICTED: coiled-coil domain-containing protein 58 [Ceratosolen solmsi marchali]|uniref:Protein MIX23 n=1 Tax=Ceratosolen solmsi marchali TaxID=326594 RepID=A0AAJ6YN78_9HYME|nr:PREDICTED: coiled-coil domain-containing protein 58 [Ceratosolen solmsi marchali]